MFSSRNAYLRKKLDQAKSLQVRFRQGGERIKPYGSDSTQALKGLFQAWGIEPWRRAQVPLIFADNELVAVADRCVAHAWAAVGSAPGLVIRWERAPI